MGMKILIFFWKKYNFMHFAFKMNTINICPENHKNLGFTSKFR